jgi:putative transposase
VGVDSRYVKNAGAVFSLTYHVVWCPKDRRPGLTGAVARSLDRLLREKAHELEMTIHALEIMPDHVHRFVESDPRWSVAEIVNRLKGVTSHDLRDRYPHLRSKLPTLWSRSYDVGSVGHVSEATVKASIANQKGR